MTPALPWWRTDDYLVADPIPPQFDHFWAGPMGVALVKVWPDGRTDPGWGQEQFMARYLRGEFNPRRVLHGYERDLWAFAWVMRSMRLVCIDIDGKNGGLTEASKLGLLPPTMAETSKSGNGYHLFYLVEDDWDRDLGYALLKDRIGIEQGVDFRGTGCVYHHKPQRWNHRAPVRFPVHLSATILEREQRLSASTERIDKILATEDAEDILIMQDNIASQLAKPIPEGKRNNTLFAIGADLARAQHPGWEKLIVDKARDLGLPDDEIAKLVANIQRYGIVPASALAAP